MMEWLVDRLNELTQTATEDDDFDKGVRFAASHIRWRIRTDDPSGADIDAARDAFIAGVEAATEPGTVPPDNPHRLFEEWATDDPENHTHDSASPEPNNPTNP